MIYIFWTCRNTEEAQNVAKLLLEKRLVACASILPEVESLYRWKGKIEIGKETKVIFKTQSKHFDPICQLILEHGSYDVPEISQIAVVGAHLPYLSWLQEETESY